MYNNVWNMRFLLCITVNMFAHFNHTSICHTKIRFDVSHSVFFIHHISVILIWWHLIVVLAVAICFRLCEIDGYLTCMIIAHKNAILSGCPFSVNSYIHTMFLFNKSTDDKLRKKKKCCDVGIYRANQVTEPSKNCKFNAKWTCFDTFFFHFVFHLQHFVQCCIEL